MRGAVLHGTGDIRLEELPDPAIVQPTDAIIRITATCICGSDLWDYRDAQEPCPRPFGHEYCGIVEEIGGDVTSIKVGQFVVGSFRASDNTCPHCRLGFHTSCQNGEWVRGCQAEAVRVPLADGTLVATPDMPDPHMVPSLLALSDVMGTGWYAADVANVRPGKTVVVVGDGAVGLCAVLAAACMGAERIIAMSRHKTRQLLARDFGATHIVAERGQEGADQIMELTDGVGADAVLECVGTAASMEQALLSTRPGGSIGFVGIPQGVSVACSDLFLTQIGLRGGLAPVRQYLPHLMELVLNRELDPSRVFDTTFLLEDVAQGYDAMNERQAIKVLLLP